ncbi:ATP-binding protein [candidate division KSB1 bacterium]|nr:ATP-binding protein [candidate division KSB1 bacterium]
MDTSIIKEIISDFHSRKLPSLTKRRIDLTCPPRKARSIIGARRTGKTYTCYQQILELMQQDISKERTLLINFEDERLIPLNVHDLSSILDAYYEMYPALKDEIVYLFLDEIQNVPQWENFVRRIIDSESIEVTITGSSAKLLSQEIATSLRGRTLSYEISPFHFVEYLDFLDIKSTSVPSSKNRSQIVHAFESFLHIGGFPEILEYSEPMRLRVLQDYMQVMLYRDLIERHDIRKHSLTKYFLKFLFANNAQPLSVNKFHQDARSQGYNCSKDTIHSYLSYLEEAFYFTTVSIFSDSIRKQQVNYRKVYAVDHGLVTAVSTSRSYNAGRLLETMMYNHLRRKFSKEKIYYYRTAQNYEIDFIVLNKEEILSLFQVCDSIQESITRNRELRALWQAMDELNVLESFLITRNEREKIEKERKIIHVIPFWEWAISWYGNALN